MSAPPGSASFRAADVARLPAPVLRTVLAPGPGAPPLEEVAAALDPADVFTVAQALEPARGERLLRLGQRPVAPEQRQAASGRLVRGLFWTLVYELAPDRWAELAELELLPEPLVADLPAGQLVVEAGAGSGRLTRHLARQGRQVVAVDLALPLCRRLRGQLPDTVTVVAGSSQHLPVATAVADLSTACAALSPDPPLGGLDALAELERVTKPGGWIALVSPEAPYWFEERGFECRSYPKPPVAAPARVVDFFGPLHPPTNLLLRHR
jgi:hypothetical protein